MSITNNRMVIGELLLATFHNIQTMRHIKTEILKYFLYSLRSKKKPKHSAVNFISRCCRSQEYVTLQWYQNFKMFKFTRS